MDFIMAKPIVVSYLVPKRVSNVFQQLAFIVAIHKEGIFEKSYPIWVQALAATTLAERHSLVEPEKRLVVT
jgi:hypothetical protein